MAVDRAEVDHDRACDEEQRRPRGVGERGDQYVAGLDLAGLVEAGDDPAAAGVATGAAAEAGQDGLHRRRRGAVRLGAALARPFRQRRRVCGQDERRVDVVQLTEGLQPLGDDRREAGRVGEVGLHLIVEQHHHIGWSGEQARRDTAPAELEERHPDLTQVQDAHQLRLLPGGDAQGRGRQRGVELGQLARRAGQQLSHPAAGGLPAFLLGPHPGGRGLTVRRVPQAGDHPERLGRVDLPRLGVEVPLVGAPAAVLGQELVERGPEPGDVIVGPFAAVHATLPRRPRRTAQTARGMPSPAGRGPTVPALERRTPGRQDRR